MVTEQIPMTVNTIENILSNSTERARDSLARLHLSYSIQQMEFSAPFSKSIKKLSALVDA